MTTQRDRLIARELAKPGLRGRVNAFCISCIYDEGSGAGAWREQTEACTALRCPLFDVRPRTKAGVQGEARTSNTAPRRGQFGYVAEDDDGQ